MNRRRNYITLVLASLFSILHAQEMNFDMIQNLSITEGLGHNGVTSMIKDSKGYYWIGTYDGLNRYDGYEFRILKNTLEEKLFFSNRIRSLLEDNKGNIWIGTDEGVNLLNSQSGEIKGLYSNQQFKGNRNGPVIRRIEVAPGMETIICCTEGEGILLFDDDYNFIGQFIPPYNMALRNTKFFDGTALDENRMLFATSSGLLLFDIDQGNFFKVYGEDLHRCLSILKVSNDKLIVCLESGVAIIDYEERQGAYVFGLSDRKLLDYSFNSAAIDRSGNLWLGSTIEGIINIQDLDSFLEGDDYTLSSYDGETGLFRVSFIDPSISDDCWVGTFNGGLFRFNLDKNPFSYYNYLMDYEHGLRSHRVMGISTLDESRAYFTSQSGGIALFNSDSKQFEAISNDLPMDYGNGIGTIFLDSKGSLWINYGGTGKFFRAIPGKPYLQENAFEKLLGIETVAAPAIEEDRFGNIWIGSTQDVYKVIMDDTGGITRIENLNSNAAFLNDRISLVRRIYPDPEHDLIWIGSDVDGLVRIDITDDPHLQDARLEHYENRVNDLTSLPSNFVSSIIRLPSGDLWIGTEGGGLCKVMNSDKEAHFNALTEKDGLSNNVVKCILYDHDENLWISTNRGLNRFNPESNSFNTYGIEDGLPFLDFTFPAASLENGTMIFAGLEGFTYFKPHEISSNEPLPQVHLDELRIFNERIQPGDSIRNRVLLQKNLSDIERLELKYNENVFSIKINSLHYSNTENHYIRYRLRPVNDDWVEIPSSQRVIYYNGLQPGEYILEYMASNSLAEWTDPKSIIIKITPPFWRTILAYIVYSLLLVFIVYQIIRFVLRMQALGYKLEIEEMEVEKVKEVNAAKLRFFSNISHEIKTPLTLLSGPVDYLSGQLKESSDVVDKLQIIRRQSKKISQLVDQVHDFQRAEANLLKLNPTRFEISEFFKELLSDFEYLAKGDRKILELKGPEEEIIVLADRKKFEKIFNNLLSNSFKFTTSGDKIVIEYAKEQNELIVSVKDTGKGIDKQDLSHVFERFYQAKKTQTDHMQGSGIGLAFTKRLVEMHYGYIEAESEAGVGTTMKLRLPVIRTRRSDDENKLVDEILSAEKDCSTEEQLMNDVDPEKIETSGEFSDAHIFLVEDDMDMRLFVTDMLANFFRVTAYANGQECLDALEAEWPDLVVSDVLMPEVNGFELSKMIKSDIRTSHIPIILLTACTAAGDQIQGIMDGADAYIFKPFNVQHLVSSIESLLKNRQQLQERYQAHLPVKLDRKKRNSSDEAFLNKLYTLMDENMDNSELDLDSFARELYLSRSNFYQKVKALTNQTPYEFLKTIRLEKAAHLLVNENLSVNEVYMITGFKSRTHFSKLFKEKYNASPGKFASETHDKYTQDA